MDRRKARSRDKLKGLVLMGLPKERRMVSLTERPMERRKAPQKELLKDLLKEQRWEIRRVLPMERPTER
jgi:hypothetical protein